MCSIKSPSHLVWRQQLQPCPSAALSRWDKLHLLPILGPDVLHVGHALFSRHARRLNCSVKSEISVSEITKHQIAKKKAGQKNKCFDFYQPVWMFMCDSVWWVCLISASSCQMQHLSLRSGAQIHTAKSRTRVCTCPCFCQRSIEIRGRTPQQPFSHIW